MMADMKFFKYQEQTKKETLVVLKPERFIIAAGKEEEFQAALDAMILAFKPEEQNDGK